MANQNAEDLKLLSSLEDVLSKKLDGIMRKKTIARSPIETNINCLDI